MTEKDETEKQTTDSILANFYRVESLIPKGQGLCQIKPSTTIAEAFDFMAKKDSPKTAGRCRESRARYVFLSFVVTQPDETSTHQRRFSHASCR